MSNKSKFRVRAMLLSLGVLCAVQSHAVNHTGQINWIEVWPSGNVAFTMTGVTVSCSLQQFIINKSNDGAKNLYAMLLTAKAMGQSIMVSQSICGNADGGGSGYAIVDYMYSYW
jgi:hypothetical protein